MLQRKCSEREEKGTNRKGRYVLSSIVVGKANDTNELKMEMYQN
jgi:hypothetical protein